MLSRFRSKPLAVSRLGRRVTMYGVIGVLLSIPVFALWSILASSGTTGVAGLLVAFFAGLLLLFGITILGIAGLTLLVGIGLWRGSHWAYPLGIFVGIASILASLGEFVDGGPLGILGLFDLVTGVSMLTSLMNSDVRVYFDKPPILRRVTELLPE